MRRHEGLLTWSFNFVRRKARHVLLTIDDLGPATFFKGIRAKVTSFGAKRISRMTASCLMEK